MERVPAPETVVIENVEFPFTVKVYPDDTTSCPFPVIEIVMDTFAFIVHTAFC